ncbi:MAG: hypothetical protein HYU29_02210 [Chloroflexi bacterium]|nr:hypothetical protein [Chloroflexota bacterium]
MAAFLWAMVDERHSFVTVAIPRLAGKSTTANAVLDLVPPGTPVHRLSGDTREMEQLKKETLGGYLVVGEFSQAPVQSYIWGEPVRQVFETLRAGYSLAVTLHASGLREAFEEICHGNGVADEDAFKIHYMLYIRRFEDIEGNFWRRLAEIHEVEGVKDGRPRGYLLYRWVEVDDTFEKVGKPLLLKASAKDLGAREELIRSMASAGRLSSEDIATMVRQYRRPG